MIARNVKILIRINLIFFFSSSSTSHALQDLRGVPEVGLWRMQLLSGHGQVRRTRQSEADVHDETVSPANVAGDCPVRVLSPGRMATDARLSHGQGARTHGGTLGTAGVRRVLRDFASGLCTATCDELSGMHQRGPAEQLGVSPLLQVGEEFRVQGEFSFL